MCMDLGRQLWGSLAGMISMGHAACPSRRQLWGWDTAAPDWLGLAPLQVPHPADRAEEPNPTAFLSESQKLKKKLLL